jgi:hypothetical protein
VDPNARVYRFTAPPDTLVRSACADVGCPMWRHGWETTVDEGTALGAEQAAYIRRSSGRTFREQRTGAGLTVFRFEPGQRCFTEHRTRPQRFTVHDGGAVRQHAGSVDWLEDCGEHLDRVVTLRERG